MIPTSAKAGSTRRKARRPKVVLPDGLESRPRLVGLKLIAAYLQLEHLELQRIIVSTANSDDPLPLFKLRPGVAANARWHVFIDELDAWMDRRSQREGGWGEKR